MRGSCTLQTVLFHLSERWDSNPRNPAWKAGALDRYATFACLSKKRDLDPRPQRWQRRALTKLSYSCL